MFINGTRRIIIYILFRNDFDFTSDILCDFRLPCTGYCNISLGTTYDMICILICTRPEPDLDVYPGDYIVTLLTWPAISEASSFLIHY